MLDATLVQVAAQPDPVQHEFIIQNFQTESGVILPEARIVYGTYGKLNDAADNAVLLPSHFMATLTGYEWLIGPGMALDPSKLFIITTELFGNGRSSSPSNTPEPHKGPRFPVVTIRDNVNATHRLLTPTVFRSGRDFAAWIGLVPRQHRQVSVGMKRPRRAFRGSCPA